MTTTPRKRVPASAPKPQDRRPKKSTEARQAEADGFVNIEQCGITLRIPIGDNVPLTAYMAFKNDDELRGTELLLGPDQWAAFLKKNPTVGDFAEIGTKLNDLLGN